MIFKPHNYQQYCIDYIKSHPISALFLDMGLGKTVITLTAVRDLMVDELKSDYDYVVIDSPAGIGSGFATAAAPADRALIVTNAEPTSLRGAIKIRTRLKSLDINDIRLIINRFDRKQFEENACYEDLDEVIDVVGVRLIALVPYDGRLSAMFQNGYAGLNWSPAMTVFDCLAKRLGGINIPLAYIG